MTPCFLLSSLSMMHRSASCARPKTYGHLLAGISMVLFRSGPLEQCTVSFCSFSPTSSTLKTEFPAAKLAPSLSAQRSASRVRSLASLRGLPSGPCLL